MDVSAAVSLCQNALWCALIISLPILAVGIIVGLVIGLFQALTQIQEQTMTVVVKMLVMAAAAAWFLPWIVTRLVEFSRQLIENIPDSLNPLI